MLFMNLRLIIKFLTFEKAKFVTDSVVVLSETNETDVRINRVICKIYYQFIPTQVMKACRGEGVKVYSSSARN